jgi:putative hemolysin
MNNPFALDKIHSSFLKTLIRKISKVDVLEKWYDEWLQQHGGENGDADLYIAHNLNRLNVTAQITNQARLADIPREGAFMVVANHPLGGVEGLLLPQLLRKIRPDLKVLTNELLSNIPEFKDVFIGVDVLNRGRAHYNARGMRTVSRHLAAGGALLVFPAGTVSHLKLPSMTLSDAPWSNMVSKLARKYSAPIMPIFVEGRNTLTFYLSGYIHKRLRTLQLPRAMINKSGETITMNIGELIPAHDLHRMSEDTVAMHYIRMCCEVLGRRTKQNAPSVRPQMEAIRQDVETAQIVAHIDSLSDCLLYQQGIFKLYCAPYTRMGPVMEQLSIERERTFRQVDEGTGLELDSDRFDPHYVHLFLWDEDAQKIAGGYRLGKTDEIVKHLGLNGLYSHSLFNYNAHFLNNMGKTIEVGRSFITQEHQRNPAALDIIWKGIGHFVVRNPEYHTLFGCVSISSKYSSLVSAMLTETFLSHYGATDSVMRSVTARTPIKGISKPWTSVQIASLSAIPIINKLVGRIDSGKSIPVLIRHYLALNGRFISFTVNHGFGNSLDGLIMVDLRHSQDKYLKRYMGTPGLAEFKKQHAQHTMAINDPRTRDHSDSAA